MSLSHLLPLEGCVKVIPGEGMPMQRNPQEKGDLAVSFDIEFPSNNFLGDELKVRCCISFDFLVFYSSISIVFSLILG